MKTARYTALSINPISASGLKAGWTLPAWWGHRASGTCGARGDCALADAVLYTTFPEVGTPTEGAAFKEVASNVKLTRYGMDCYAYALIAAGQVDLVIEAGLQIYDIQAPLAVVEAAGGIVTDWRGGPAHQGGRILAAGGRQQHEAALEILSRFA